ncbi:transporter [Pseudoalteromonas sp.]|uniref:transporter n=1 Tax=Pseudoalteromonas sp. TaxID=53249 RepID=UPI00356B080D
MNKRFGMLIIWFSSLTMLLGAVLWLNKPLFSADMLSLLPPSQAKMARAEQLFFAKNADNVMFSFAGKHKEAAHDALTAWLAQQQIHSTFNWPSVTSLAATFAPYKYALLSESYKQQLQNKRRFEHAYLTQLNQLGDPFVSSTLAADNSLSLAAFIRDNLLQSQVVSLQQNRLTRRYDGIDYTLIFATLGTSQLGINQAVSLANNIKNKIASLEKRYPNTVIRYSGVLFHTAENSQQAQYEMSLFGGISLLALVVMVFWVFRRLNSVLLASFTVLSALMGGAIALLSVFHSVHLLTLVFAVTLIGIAIDYAFHGMTDLAAQHTQSTPQPGYSNGVKAALLLSLTTTLLGYSTLLGAPLSLLAQVAVFVIAGLVSAWLFTLLILPNWQTALCLSPASLAVSAKVTQQLVRFNTLKKPLFIILAVLLTALYVLKPVTFNDDIRLLNASSKQLMANEKKHLTLLGQWQSHIIVLFADNAEQLLQKQQRLLAALSAQNPEFSHNAITRWLPSVAQQQQNLALFQQAKEDGLFALSEQITGQNIVTTGAQTLSYDNLVNSAFKPLLLSQMVVTADQAISWMSVSGIDSAALSAELVNYPEVFLYNKALQISTLLSDYRHYLLLTLAVAASISWLLFSWRFGAKVAALQVVSLAGVVASMLWLCNSIQGSLSLFNLLGALLVIALAIDYLVFYQINKLQPSNVLAISLSAASSMWVFGMLSASSTPAIFSFGLTVMVGILAVYILSPLTVLRVEKE